MQQDVDFDEQVFPYDLRTEDDSGLIASAFPAPRLSWRLNASRRGVRQTFYEIEVADDAAFGVGVERSGVVKTATPLFASWPAAPLQSRERRWWRVRVRTEMGWTRWSEGAAVEGTLFEPNDWLARPISPRSNVGRIDRSPPCLLRRQFDVSDCVSARLYVSALGACQVTINGEPVSKDLLEPGWTNYRDRTLFSAYDILPLLRSGSNCVAAQVSDGWWRGELGWLGQRGHYGDTTALIAQIEMVTRAGERVVIATDQAWRSAYGATQMAELYDGVDVDRREDPEGWDRPGFDDAEWEEVVVMRDLPPGLEQRSMPAIQVLESFEPVGMEYLAGRIHVDARQNLVGFLRIRARGPRGAALTARHAEMLEADGSLHLAPLRNARAADNYILRGHGEVELLAPSFTFHGFRYAEISFDPGIEVMDVEIVRIGSKLDYSGRFHCSNDDINKLFENSVQSQKGNFIALPTDCPQRDERLGWTGDIQVFSETACFHADARSFLASWLKDVATEQRADGNVPAVVPNIIQGHEFEFGGVGWGDAATLVPWTLYRMFDDRGVLERQYESMRAWVDYCVTRLNDDSVWVGDFQLGDWLDPGAPPDQPHRATTQGDYIATCYLSYSAQCLGKAAQVLGRERDAKTYSALARRVADAAWRRWSEPAQATQTGCAMAVMFDIAPAPEIDAVGRRLAGLVEASGGRIATGFLGTPLVLPALSRTGQMEAAFRLLLNRKCPGWLYQVDRGATTMWERWDAVREDGFLHAGAMSTHDGNSMTSFNHYAYGAVSAWLYQAVAGLSPDQPGFERIAFAPQPGGGITWAGASLMTGYGPASIHWALEDGGMSVEVSVPPGATGVLQCPEAFVFPDGNEVLDLVSGDHRFELVPMATLKKLKSESVSVGPEK